MESREGAEQLGIGYYLPGTVIIAKISAAKPRLESIIIRPHDPLGNERTRDFEI